MVNSHSTPFLIRSNRRPDEASNGSLTPMSSGQLRGMVRVPRRLQHPNSRHHIEVCAGGTTTPAVPRPAQPMR